MAQTFFFYDLETSGLDSRADRIMQFAGQRTDIDLNPIGDPVNLMISLSDDTLPSPHAIAVTKITPQATKYDGISEAEFAKYITTEIFTPETCALGYNTVRFDDEFIRHLLWRNFFDPYEWQWRDGRSKWDLLDVVRMTRALRPDGIKWPVDKDGKATNRLELLTKLNNISHDSAHDALSDVSATLAVARLIRDKQPALFGWLQKIRDKKALAKLINLDDKQPFVYVSGRYDSAFEKATVAFPLTSGRNGNIMAFDLRYNLDDLLSAKNDSKDTKQGFYPIVKELHFGHCPAVAPLGVLDQEGGWGRISLDRPTIEKNLASLLKHPDFAEKVREDIEQKPNFPPPVDSESALYDGFIDGSDRIRCEAVRNANAEKLADFTPDFADERLPELLVHYKARNFPKSLNPSEQAEWQTYRANRLNRQAPDFLTALSEIAKNPENDFIAEELRLWYESLL